ncbi:MAG: glycosyltransferase family 2 protein [Proteobacteria bacterium]|nr:glycosyltransferase family 2 protein [Pseudomonadota bacterium]MBU1714533.1 glycosyltransferase family 2 protein [Pseudomonadota bacterium]
MNKPFFSVLIPTKNRAHIVGYAIQSVLNQSFTDFEIIVVDNDDSETTRSAVQKFSDPRVKYFRTSGLNMCENWEYALVQAQGEYVTVLEDKQAYYRFALEKISSVISCEGVEVVAWGWDVYMDKIRTAYKTSSGCGVEKMSSDHVLCKYTTSTQDVWELLPRMLNSCISQKVINKIKSYPAVDKFFSEVSPDLCAAFYTLAEVDELCFVKERLGLVGYLNLSNAEKFRSSKNKEMSYFGKEDFSEMLVDHVPIKECRLTHNTIYNDFLRIRERMSGRLAKYQMTPYIYAKTCVSDLVQVPFLIGPAFEEIVSFMKLHKLPMFSLWFFFLIRRIDRWFVNFFAKYDWLQKLNIRRKREIWEADNILEATRLMGDMCAVSVKD